MSQDAQEPTTEQFERVMALADGGHFPRSTALGLLRHLQRDQIDDLLPSQEYLHRSISRARRGAQELERITLRMRVAALELSWQAPAYAA